VQGRKTIRTKVNGCIPRLLKRRTIRRFIRNRDGATAIEFAMVGIPFLALLFAILETAFVFLAGQTLNLAVTNTSRLIMTGQAQAAGYTATTFQNAVCANLVAFFNCNNLYLNVQTYSSFALTSMTPPVTNGQLNTNNLQFQMGGPGDVVVVQVYYQWPIVAPLLDQLANLAGNNRLLVGTAVFKNEPY
jgi:Flp pilus assembly protein TadG